MPVGSEMRQFYMPIDTVGIIFNGIVHKRYGLGLVIHQARATAWRSPK
ncbi:MAG: hypothetical protein Q8P67_13750 [archaeon]|nr:hypothetical protein [archaeon]